jgi:glutamyl-tRNA synthetase
MAEFPGFAGFLFGPVEPDPALLDRRILGFAETALMGVGPWTADGIETALKGLCEEIGEKPRAVYLPIRVAATGSRVSPGLYESLELLGKDESLKRIRSAASVAAAAS